MEEFSTYRYLRKARHCFNKKESLHKKAMLLFKQYMLVGRMPQAVDAYLQGRYKTKVLSIFEQIPGFLSKHEKRIRLNRIANGSSIDQYDDTFFWLGNSMICNECFLTKDPNVGLSLNEERSSMKCYMRDTGLLVSHTFDENELSDGQLYQQIMRDRLSINKGMIYENVIAQMLNANGNKLYFYTHYNKEKHRNDIEIDFIISNNSKLKYKIYPIEVKSSKKYSTKSLERFREKYRDRIGECYIIHPKPFSVNNGFICIPPYMTMCL